MSLTRKVVLIGAGNVAASLAPSIDAVDGLELSQIVSSDGRSAALLAEAAGGCDAATPDSIMTGADIYIFAVSDTALSRLASSLPPLPGALCLHTSGSVDASVLAPLTGRYGVLYPLQTFTRGVTLDLRAVPFFIEGSSPEVTSEIMQLARSLSDTVHTADSAMRRRMHVAAVFGCNFVTHMLDISDNLLRRDGLDISVLSPLISETIRKSLEIGPHAAQTGPARRGDKAVTGKHEEMLADDSHLCEIYRLLSDSISRAYQQN